MIDITSSSLSLLTCKMGIVVPSLGREYRRGLAWGKCSMGNNHILPQTLVHEGYKDRWDPFLLPRTRTYWSRKTHGHLIIQSSRKSLSHVRLFETPWTVARQASLSMEFSRQEYCSALPCSPPEDLPQPESLKFPALAGEFFTTSATREALESLLPTAKGWSPTHFPDKFLKFYIVFSYTCQCFPSDHMVP